MKTPRPLSILAIASISLLALAAVSAAEVNVTIGFQPIEPAPPSTDVTAPPPPNAFGLDRTENGDRGMVIGIEETWYINYFQADLSQPADATLWAVRNEDETPVDIQVVYFPTTSFSVPYTGEMFTIPVHGVKTRNTRDVAGLPAGIDGFARGHIRIQATGDVSVDFFQAIGSQDFATSDVAGVPADICDDLSFRFIDFGGDLGSVATFLVGFPLGAGPGDPPTLVGAVYDEAGAFINSFVVRTDEYSFLLDVRSFVLPGTLFGSIEINASAADGTIATITHRAGGRFSVSNSVSCRDFVPILI